MKQREHKATAWSDDGTMPRHCLLSKWLDEKKIGKTENAHILNLKSHLVYEDGILPNLKKHPFPR